MQEGDWDPTAAKRAINVAALIEALQAHALSEGPLMEPSQVRAAQLLLGKMLPDVRAVELTGADGGSVNHQLSFDFSAMDDEDLARIASLQVRHATDGG